MKTPFLTVLCLFVTTTLFAQPSAGIPPANVRKKPQPHSAPYSVAERDANSRVWQRTTYEKSPSGELIPRMHSYTELATGMHYQQGNHWVESKEEIEIQPAGGAAAIHGQHQAYFPSDIYDGVIEVVTPDGQHLQSRPMGISYFDGTNNVLIAELKHSVGQLLPNGNQVIYTNAFTEFAADLLLTYRRGGVECDLVLREQPPGPEGYGLNPTTSRLELYTEFFNTGDPAHGPASINHRNGLLDNPILDFGAMQMIPGKAFGVGQDDNTPIAVSKTWTHLQGRTFLIEEVPIPQITSLLQQLPKPPSNGIGVGAQGSQHHASASPVLSPSRTISGMTNSVRMAEADMQKKPGFVLDYNLVLPQTNYTFQADTTYYIAGTVNLAGVTTIEGNTVIKCNTNTGAALNILGTVNCLTAPYRPAVITSSGDSTLGEPVPGTPGNGYSGAPYFLNVNNRTGVDLLVTVWEAYDEYSYTYPVYYQPLYAGQQDYYGIDFSYSSTFSFYASDPSYFYYEMDITPQLQQGLLDIVSPSSLTYYEWGDSLGPPPVISTTALILANGGALHDLRFCYVDTAIFSTTNYSITNAQFLNCSTAFKSQNATLTAGNILMNNVGIGFAGSSYQATVKQLTYDQGTRVTTNSSGSSSLSLVNSLLTGITNYGNASITTNHVVVVASSSGVYQTNGGGNHYLADNTYRGIGTNLDTALASQLAQKTTYPPISYTNVTFTNVFVFSPQALRDTNATPDLGYHYDPLDYTFGGCTANSNITFSAGTAAGWFRTTSGTSHAGYGIHAADNSVVTFNGTAAAPDYWVRLNTVQERDWSGGSGTAGISGWATATNAAPIVRGSFVRASTMASEIGNHFAYNDGFLNIQLSHSEFWSGGLGGGSGSYSALLNLTNSLADRCSLTIYGSSANVVMRNMTMRAGNFTVNHSSSSAWSADVTDCAFDGTTISVNSGSDTNLIHYAYNAYLTNATRLTPTNINDLIVTNFNWQTGPSGRFYLPTTSTLINAGSRTADLAGLYHFTTQTNQAKETNSIVDIGYHYSVLDGSGNSLDSGGDGIPDYIDDPNGNGIVDVGEFDWRTATNSVPYGAGGYLYHVVTIGGTIDFYTENFDDSGFSNGRAAFGSIDPFCPLSTTNTVKTIWTTNTDLLLRRHFTVPAGTTNLSLGLAIDDDAQIFINGIEITPTDVVQTFFYTNANQTEKAWFETNWFKHVYCASYDSIVLSGISPSIWRQGDNLLAVRVRDTGGAITFGDVRVSCFPPRGTHVLASMLAPTNGQFFALSPTNIILTGWVGNSVGSISTVSFYAGSTWLGNGTDIGNGAYSLLWTNVAAGSYSLSIRATNSLNDWGGSGPVSATINSMPTVSIISPTNLQLFFEITNVQMTVLASDAEDGTNVTVTFYTNNISAGNAVHAGGSTNSLVWTSLTANSHPTNYYSVVAVATDSKGASSASAIRVFKVATTNPVPAVRITSPTNGASFAPGSDITIIASATNFPASVTNVEFFVNGESIGNDSTADYEVQKCCWTPGAYSLVAVASDNAGRVVASSNINIIIVPEVPAGEGYWDMVFNNPYTESESELEEYFAPVVSVETNVYTYNFADTWSYSILQRWDGINWTGVWLPTDHRIINQILADGTNLYISGNWDSASTPGVYELSGANWSLVSEMVSNPISGAGTNWFRVGDELDAYRDHAFSSDSHFRYLEENSTNGPIDASTKMVMIGSDLYVGGAFVSASDTNIVYIAKLNRQSNIWERVGNGLNAPVYTLCNYSNQLVIGGAFTNAGGNPLANHIAILVGNVWTNLGAGISGGPTFYRDDTLSDYPVPPDGEVWSLAACGNNLFAGGNFTTAGNNTNANGIAVWNGSEWRSMRRGLYPIGPAMNIAMTNLLVTSIVPRGNTVYVGGQFGGAWGEGTNKIRAYNIAQATWDENQQAWSWSDLDLGILGTMDPAEGGTLDTPVESGLVFGMSIVNGPNLQSYDLYVGGAYSERGSSEILTEGIDIVPSGFARWRVGYPQPATNPIVTIRQPSSPYIFTNLTSPTNIFLIGQAESHYTNFLYNEVHFYTNGVEIGTRQFSYQESNSLFFTNQWDNPSPGLYLINAVAKDDGGLIGESAPIVVNVKSASNSVTAIDDQYTIPQGTIAVTLPVLTNDFPSSGLRITEFTMLNHNLGQPRISPDGKYLTYTPLPKAFGTDTFYYTASDGTNSDSASVTVKILAHPVVAISAPDDLRRFVVSSPPITLTATATDHDGAITNVVIYTNGVAYKALTNNVSGNFSTNWTASATGFYTFAAVATDSDGLSSTSAPVTVVLTNTSASAHMPVAVISNLVATAVNNQGVVTESLPVIKSGLFDLQGQASDADGDVVSYAVQLFRPQDWDFKASDDLAILIPLTNPFADLTPGPKNVQGFHIGGTNGSLGNLDLTGVPDGVYDLVLRVRGGTDETHAVVRVQLQSDLKVGQFSFSEQDLVLPVNGIPLAVTRTYNSLNPESGAFGASWSFALNDMNVKLDDERTDVTIGSDNAPFDVDDPDTSVRSLPKVVSVRTGGNWDVTLTLPDGKRTTFVFGYTGEWPTLHATWTAPAGITAKLEPITGGDADIVFGFSGLSVPIWQTSQSGSHSPIVAYPPFENQDFPGWILTTTDGTKYRITRESGGHVAYDSDGSGHYISARVYGPPKLTEIDQLSTNKIIINSNGIFNYDPANVLTRWTLFERDDANRIRALRDPNGGSNGLPVVRYIYNHNTSNLIQVLKLVDRNASRYTTNKYHYDNLKFPHYITSIENGDGVAVARNFYDDSGRLTAVQDANGTMTQFHHSLTNNSEIVIDRLGHTNSYVYDLKGNVIWTTNALGQVTATAYNDPNNANLETAVTNAYGTAQATWTLYSYDSLGNQTNVISMGHTNSFQYDGTGNLLTQIDPLGNVARNLYDSAGNLTNSAQYDANNHLMTQSSAVYNYGKLIRTLNANGQTNATFGYDAYGNLTNTTDANGFAHSFGYDSNGNQTNSSYQWTPPGGGSAKTVRNMTVYDAQNRVIQSIDALGNTNRTSYNTLGKVDYTIDKFGNTNSFLYDALGNLIQTTYPNGATRSVYDAAGRAYLATDRNGITGTRIDFDAAGRATNTVRLTNVVVDIVYSGSVAQSVVMSAGVPISTNSTVYDPAGRVTSRTSPDGTATFEYYSDGQLMRVIDALNNTNFFAYDAAGRQTNTVDALNHSTKFYYDALGRMTNTLYADNRGITNIFNNLGQRTNVIDQAGLLTQFGYSISGQLTNVIKPTVPDPDNSGISTNAQWSYLYDSYGRPTVTIDPKGHGTTNFFDAYGRQFSQRLAMNQTNLVVYNSLDQVATNYDFLSQRTEFYYDRFGRLTNKFYFVTGQTHPSNSVSYIYNQLDQLTNITERYGSDADGIYAVNNVEPQDFRFATLLVFINRTAPRWGGVLLPLLALGCALMLTASGRRLRYILVWYYVQGGWRLKTEAAVTGRTKRPRLPSFFWRMVTILTAVVLVVDDPGWEGAFTAQAVCDIPTPTSTLLKRVTNFAYDVEGRLKQVDAPEGVINYTYDPATGRLKSMCTDYSAWDYTYELGRLKTVHVSKRAGSDVNETTTYAYDGVGNRSSVTLPNGVVTTYKYDSLNRLTNMMHKLTATSTTNAVYSYKLDATGRRTNAVEVLLQEGGAGYLTNTMSWRFDGMYRLTNEVNLCSAAGASYTNSYSYNLAGNRLKQITRAGNLITVTNSYDANDELLREVTQTGVNYTETNNYAYDLNGSMTGKTNIAASVNTTTYGYDLMNKLGNVVTNGTLQASYQYNAQGIRVRANVGGTTNYYLIDANNHTGYQQVLEEYTALRGTPTRSYLLGDDVLAQTVSGIVSYLLYDGHGSTRQVSGSAGAVTSRYNYDAYGLTQSTSTTTAETSLLYCGEQYDSGLGMYNLRARYYNPSNGRFNQRDTFWGHNEDPQSLHKYTYCQGDAVNGIDPTGNFDLIGLMNTITIGAYAFATTFPVLTLGIVLAIGIAFPDFYEGIPPGSPGPLDELHDFGAAIKALKSSGAVRIESQTILRGINISNFKSKGSFLDSLLNGSRNQGRYSYAGSKVLYGGQTMKEVDAEVAHYATVAGQSVSKAINETAVAEIRVTGQTLDLTDNKIFGKLGLTIDELKDKMTGGSSTKLRELAIQLKKEGVQILKVPSARLDGGVNIVVLDDILSEGNVTIVKPQP